LKLHHHATETCGGLHKTLMWRIARASIAREGGTTVESDNISEALDDMLFAVGKLNVKLLRPLAGGRAVADVCGICLEVTHG
jgi:hypothetical protein